MNVSKQILEITEDNDAGYHVLISYDTWRVAIFNEQVSSSIESLSYMEYHSLTDEVFILLKGNCVLLVSKGQDKPNKIYAVNMEPFKFYNIKKGVWHNILLHNNGSVAIVENSDTNKSNSVYYKLNEEDLKNINQLFGSSN